MTYYFRGLYSEITEWANPKVFRHWPLSLVPWVNTHRRMRSRLERGRVQGAAYTSRSLMSYVKIATARRDFFSLERN